MALFNVTLDNLNGQFSAASKRDAAYAAMKMWNRGGQFSVQAVAEEKAPTTARREYKCDCCGGVIAKGDGYFKVQRSIGSPDKETFDGVNVVVHGIRYAAQVCVACKSA